METSLVDTPNLAQWRHWLWTLGSPAQADVAQATFERMYQAWRSPGRHYHTLTHLRACLALLRSWGPVHGLTPSEDALLGLALCFHDAVYDPERSDNEVRSAALAREELLKAGLPADRVEAVADLVLLTEHGRELATPALSDSLVDLLLDIDLAVLGADAATYARYEQAIAQEYAWVAPEQYSLARARVLRMFLPRKAGGSSSHAHVFRTEVARAQRELQAHANLQQALAALPPA